MSDLEGEKPPAPRGPLVHLVGEMNPYGSDPRFALYDEPSGASGQRLREYILALHRRTYLSDSLITRRNLCVGHWSIHAARGAWERLVDELAPGDLIVALGRRVISAHREQPVPFHTCRIGSRRTTVLALPHPSGMCREWNDPVAATRARTILRQLAPQIRWGELIGEVG